MDFRKLVETVIREQLNLIVKDVDGYVVWHQTDQKVYDLFYYDKVGNKADLPIETDQLLRKAFELKSTFIFGDNKFIALKHGLLHIEDKESFDTERFYQDQVFRQGFFLACHLRHLAKFGYEGALWRGCSQAP